MIILLQNILSRITTVFLWCLLLVNRINTYPYDWHNNWKSVEAVAEEYPYVVGLLDNDKQYMCTGISINNRTVLTSGDCVSPQPRFIATASAVLENDITGNNIIKVASAVPHSEYTFTLKPYEPNSTQVHSNLGLVFADRPVLDAVLEVAKMGYYYASELRERRLTVVGYGDIYTGRAVLRKQDYHQVPCFNPKWYYCVCGIEYSAYNQNDIFGRGGPVFLDTKLVGVAVAPCGLMVLPGIAVRYNIFTVIAPYLRWITTNPPKKEIFRTVVESKKVESHGHKEINTAWKVSGHHRYNILQFAWSCVLAVIARNMSQAMQWKPLERVGIIGVPFEKGQKKYGVSIAPAAMRSSGLLAKLKEIDGLNVKDYGDVDVNASVERAVVENMSDLAQVSACNKKLSEKVTQVLKDNRIAVTIGGDHSIGVGTVDGHYKVNEDMILIWVDAHADLNTNKTSGSGSVHGMPVALLAKELSDYWPYLPTMDWQVPKFSIKSLGYIGLRSVDSYERFAIEKYDVPAFAMEDVGKHGIANSINHVLHVLDPSGSRPIHVSFDIDALDALEAPSTGTPVRGGLTLREGITLMEIIHATGRLRAVDLVEINPAVGDASDRCRTLEAGLCILRAALGFSRRGTAPRGVLDLPLQTHHEHHHLST